MPDLVNINLIVILAVFAVTVTVYAFIARRRKRGGKHRLFRKRARRVARILSRGREADSAGKMAYLRKINPYVFEELVLDGFRSKGYGVKRNRRYSGDGGIDGRVYLDGKEYLVQCKRYKGHVRSADVMSFSALCAERGCGGFFVHTGKTGHGSKDAARFADVRIISGKSLLDLLNCER